MVRKGTGPITPIVEKGDIGVLCQVVDSEEGLVPFSQQDAETVSWETGYGAVPVTENTNHAIPLRRRIKLMAIVTRRFRIERILHTGFGGSGDESTNGQSVTAGYPFILVEASSVYDVRPELRSVDRDLISCTRNRGLSDELIVAGIKRQNDFLNTLNNDCYSFSRGGITWNASQGDTVINPSIATNNSTTRNHYGEELWSFSIAHALFSSFRPTALELLHLLTTTCTKQRFELIYNLYKKHCASK